MAGTFTDSATAVAVQVGVDRRRAAERGIHASYVNLAASLVLSFVLTPVILSALGARDYGLWAILNALSSYLLLADFGLGAAVTKYAAEYVATARQGALNALLSTVLLVFVCAGAVMLAASFAVVWFVPGWFKIGPDGAAAARVAFVLMVASAGLGLITSVLANIICGYQRVDAAKMLATVLVVGNAVGVVACTKTGLGLVGLSAVTVTTGLAGVVLYGGFIRTSGWGLRFSRRLADMGSLREVWPYSLRTLSLGLTSRVLYQTDSIVIGVFLGAQAVTPYAIAYRICFVATYAFSQLSTGMFPTFARLWALKERGELATKYLLITRMSMGVMMPIGIGLALFGRSFINAWVGHDAVAGLSVLLILVAMDFVHAVGTPAGVLLQSTGRNKTFMYSEMANALLNLSLSVFLVRKLGIAGVALGTLIAHVCTSGWLVPVLACGNVGLKARVFIPRGLVPPVLAGVPALVVGSLANRFWPEAGFLGIGVKALLVVAAYAPVYLSMSAAETERRYVRNALRFRSRNTGT